MEILYFKGCPGLAASRDVLERAIRETGLEGIGVVPVRLGPDEWSGLPGSPTILVDGEDLFPTEPGATTNGGPTCRIYATPEGPRNHPTVGMVREALQERARRARNGA